MIQLVNLILPKQELEMTQEVLEQAPEAPLTRRGVPLYDENPFIPSIQVKTRRVTNKRGNMALVNTDTGEVGANIAGFWEAQEVDSTKFVKLFVNGVRALAELTNAGTRVFEILYDEMQKNIGSDQVYLSYVGLPQKEDAISRSTFARGLSELMDKKFLAAKTAPGWYWVNPAFIWNGDRLVFYREYRRVRKNRKGDVKTLPMFGD